MNKRGNFVINNLNIAVYLVFGIVFHFHCSKIIVQIVTELNALSLESLPSNISLINRSL